MTDLATLNANVAQLNPADFPRIVEVLEKIAQAKRWLAELQREAEGKAVESLQASGGVELNGVRWYAGATKDYKPRDIKALAEAVMQASGGDWERFIQCLSSGAFKAGACRQLFEESHDGGKFGEVFDVIEKWEMREGKPQAKLQKMPLALVK